MSTPKDLIEARIQNFLGHGNLHSNLWFIGMEEGHDGTLEDVCKKFLRTHGKKVFDPRPSARWFVEGARIQSTWGKLIRILLATKHPKEIAMDKERVRAFQIESFGKEDADHAMLDLMPLPNSAIGTWLYGKLGISDLESREAYKARYRPQRITLFKRIIAQHKPKAVVLCSFTFKNHVWSALAGGEFSEIAVGRGKIYHRKASGTDYFVVPHPAARQALGNDYWFGVGQLVKRV